MPVEKGTLPAPKRVRQTSPPTSLSLDFEKSDSHTRESFTMGSRRYLGGKSKLLDFIENQVRSALGRNPKSIFDVFAGTGVVSERFSSLGARILANDLLLHNSTALNGFLGPDPVDLLELREKVHYLSGCEGSDNYVSHHFGGTYFSVENARRIGAIRDEIENITTPGREKDALVTSLLYAADRVANTVGHYDAFYRGPQLKGELKLKVPRVHVNTEKNIISRDDANNIAGRFEAEVAYLDPPYNSRQYSDAYHLLENIARWEKPEVFGVARKMDRTLLKSDFCGRGAAAAFDELIQKLRTELIVVSYNNTSSSLNPRSNAAISDDQLFTSLRRRGSVSVVETNFGAFTTGKTKRQGHSERLFICKVERT